MGCFLKAINLIQYFKLRCEHSLKLTKHYEIELLWFCCLDEKTINTYQLTLSLYGFSRNKIKIT